MPASSKRFVAMASTATAPRRTRQSKRGSSLSASLARKIGVAHALLPTLSKMSLRWVAHPLVTLTVMRLARLARIVLEANSVCRAATSSASIPLQPKLFRTSHTDARFSKPISLSSAQTRSKPSFNWRRRVALLSVLHQRLIGAGVYRSLRWPNGYHKTKDGPASFLQLGFQRSLTPKG